MDLPVEFDMAFAFEHIVHFSHSFVVVELAVFLYLHQVHRCHLILIVHKGPACLATGAGRRFDFCEPCNLKILFDHFVFHAIVYAFERTMKGTLSHLYHRNPVTINECRTTLLT